MTRVAIELRVRAAQFVFGAQRVIVANLGPLLVTMAILAFFAKTRPMRILGTVATDTAAWQLVVKLAASMAGRTGQSRMATEQRKAGYLGVIEFRVAPTALGMTLTAVVAALAAMDIVGRVASGAGLGRAVVLAANVAGIAAHRAVRFDQAKIGLVVIELGGTPCGIVVAGAAVAIELPAMQIIRFVTVRADFLGRTKSSAGLVATDAVLVQMCA